MEYIKQQIGDAELYFSVVTDETDCGYETSEMNLEGINTDEEHLNVEVVFAY